MENIFDVKIRNAFSPVPMNKFKNKTELSFFSCEIPYFVKSSNLVLNHFEEYFQIDSDPSSKV